VHVNVVLVDGALVLKVTPSKAGSFRVDASSPWSRAMSSCGVDGKGGFGQDRMLGGADSCGWKSGCSVSGNAWSPGE